MRYRIARIGVAVLVALILSMSARAEEVDLELVLAVDVSRSIDDEEFALQRRGYAEAFQHPSIIRAIQSGRHGRIAVAYVEWAGWDLQKLVVPWTVVSDPESGALLADVILREERSVYGWTSVSGAIDFSMRVLAASPHESPRRVIDISGGGINNSGRPSDEARDDAVTAGVTINGLVIMNDRPTPGFFQMPQPPLDEFYRDHVIGGSGAFVIAVEDFTTFAQAILSKLIKEIAQVPAVR